MFSSPGTPSNVGLFHIRLLPGFDIVPIMIIVHFLREFHSHLELQTYTCTYFSFVYVCAVGVNLATSRPLLRANGLFVLSAFSSLSLSR